MSGGAGNVIIYDGLIISQNLSPSQAGILISRDGGALPDTIAPLRRVH